MWLVENKCPVCKKTFIPAPQHMYKIANGQKLVCSYHCMLDDERAAEKRRQKVREKMRAKAKTKGERK